MHKHASIALGDISKADIRTWHKRWGEAGPTAANHHDPFPIEKSERRFFVLASRAEPKDSSYYDHLWNWSEKHPGVVLNWLLSRDLSKFSPTDRPPQTDGREAMIEASRSELEIDMADRIGNHEPPFRFDLVELKSIDEFYRNLMGHSVKGVRQTMHVLGCQNLFQHKLVDAGATQKKSLWCVRDHEKWLKMAKSERLRAFLNYQNGPQPTSQDDDQSQMPF